MRILITRKHRVNHFLGGTAVLDRDSAVFSRKPDRYLRRPNKLQPIENTEKILAPGGELPPEVLKHRRILSSLVSSDPFGKFSTLFDFSTGYKGADVHRYDPICSVLSIELLQFYYSATTAASIVREKSPAQKCPVLPRACERTANLRFNGSFSEPDS